jgi:hypothetical protein
MISTHIDNIIIAGRDIDTSREIVVASTGGACFGLIGWDNMDYRSA